MPFLLSGLVILGALVPSQSSAQSSQPSILPQEGAAIAGRIVNGSGEPLVGVRVLALKRGPMMPDGTRPLLAWAENRTNELGEFRVFGLPPGEYFVGAITTRQPPFATSTTATAMLAPTFFPGTPDESRAQPITVAADQTAADIVFRIVSVPAYRISGVVVDETDAPVRGAMVLLMDGPGARSYWVSTKSAAFVADVGEALSDQDGRFVIGSVTMGSYILTAPLPGSLPGRIPITVDRADVTDVRIVVHRQR
jgi:hypothetical protein